MKPKFKNTLAWEQAQLLMQPVLIRAIDNIGKRLERSPWQGIYQEITTPYPGYQLHLTLNQQTVIVNIWELCYQICFQVYPPTHSENTVVEVEIDTSLLDEAGEINWQRLDEKAKQVVDEIFENLPKQ
jgi:hypothetical protein